jgi:mRNA interferase RelE/StbE
MVVKFRKESIKFWQTLPEDAARIRNQLNQLIIAIEEQSIIPCTDLDIKKMKGEWEGFYWLRVGKIQVKPNSS